MNWLLIVLIGVAALLLIIVLAKLNRKDQQRFTDQLNSNYRKSKDEEGDAEIEEGRDSKY
jgi:hypothetical protein